MKFNSSKNHFASQQHKKRSQLTTVSTKLIIRAVLPWQNYGI